MLFEYKSHTFQNESKNTVLRIIGIVLQMNNVGSESIQLENRKVRPKLS